MKRFNMIGDMISDEAKWFYDWLEMPSVTHSAIRQFLTEAGGDDIELYIDSPGGLLNVGSDIYGELRAYAGNSTSYVLGVAGSAASVAMLGAKKIVAIPTARVVIHNAQSAAEGDYRAMKEAQQRLKEASESIINAYEIKTGMSRTALQALMDRTTSMSAQTALEYGFIDEVALKEGEHLTAIENSIEARDVLAKLGMRTYNSLKLHEIAALAKDIVQNDSGGERRPVSDIQLAEQRRQFAAIRRRIYT